MRTLLFRFLATATGVAALVGCGPDIGHPQDSDAAPIVVDAAIDASIEIPDATVVGFGEPCTTNAECGEGFCVDSGGGGGLCSRRCNNDCPIGWTCREVTLPDEVANVCIPQFSLHCSHCTTDGECPGGACLQIDGEGRCAATCATAGECLLSYQCLADSAGTHTGTFCQPQTGSCDCGPGLDGATRTCSTTNAVGTCWGLETCDHTTGWSACTAATAAAETCDGVDNDCDFVIDDGVGGGVACTNDVPGVGSCPGLTTCAGPSGFTCTGPTPMPESCNFLDDDCDGQVDEAFALGALCNAGVGACLSYGVVSCRPDGTGTQCTATAGTPVPESCDGLDDDCDGATDETYPALGTLCTAGLGICSRLGTTICSADTTTTACSATPGPPDPLELCNYVDDDCDGLLDEGFRNPATGLYDQNTTCGSCEIDCTSLYAAPFAFGTCTVAGTPQCVMSCNAGHFNLNGSTLDGCEFLLDVDAIHVSADDPAAVDNAGCGLGPVGTGAGKYPCRTIAQGLARASSTGRSKVLVADGTYNEAVTLVNGKNLLGGYRADTWERHLATTSTAIQGVSSTGNHDRTVIASGITLPTTFEGFIVYGAFNAKTGGNSYAMYVTASNSNLSIHDNLIFAGRGGPGGAGLVGLNGATGANGVGRDAVTASMYDAKIATGGGMCSVANNRQYANGAVMACGGTLVSGGNGGGNRCSPVTSASEYSGIDGFGGLPPPTGIGGDAGDDGYFGLFMGFVVCFVPAAPMFGEDGAEGASAANATGVAGCTNPNGSVSGGHWTAGAALSGLAAASGTGGGGGGAGGGGSTAAGTIPSPPGDRLGGHGGGAAAGGCGGMGGGAAGGGGGVFGIFVSGGSAPTITDNFITRGDGGTGGIGGNGGTGGLGGTGGAGGETALLCAGKGGRGGDGGAGGHGSGGGGGCGGASFGIYTSGVGVPLYCGAAAANVINGGSGGPAGAGGASGGAPGGGGQPGTLTACSFN